MTSVLVCGATGNVGKEVVRCLLTRESGVIAAHRQPDRARRQLGEHIKTVALDFHDRTTWRAALADADHLFLMRPPAIADVQNNIIPFIDLARAQGVDHIVFLSVAGAGTNKFVPHRKVEDHLRSTSDRFTNLRPGFFSQNLQSAYWQDIVEDNRIYVPAGHRQPVNWIDVRDIAEVAALIFQAPSEHRALDYTLTGPGPVPWSEVVSALSKELGRDIHYEAASLCGYMAHLAQRDLPMGAIGVQTLLHFLLRFGQGATVDPTLHRLLGRPGTSIQQYIADNADIWRADEAQETAATGRKEPR